MTINNISSKDTITARSAINELSEIIESSEKQAVIRDYEEVFIQNILSELKVCTYLYFIPCGI